jgi:hypothetical protein
MKNRCKVTRDMVVLKGRARERGVLEDKVVLKDKDVVNVVLRITGGWCDCGHWRQRSLPRNVSSIWFLLCIKSYLSTFA